MAAKPLNTTPKKAWYLRPYLIGLIMAVAGCLYFLLFPISSNNFLSWNPGQLHSSHQFMNNNCQACHQNSFEKVQDSSCSQCHKMENHADKDGRLHHRRIKSEGTCVDCHLEHSGHKALLQSDNRLCIDCHAELSKAVKEPLYKNVESLSSHPPFSVPDITARQEIGKGASDKNTLKLNHALHLKKDLRGPEGPVQLQCADCHSFSKQSGNFSIKVSFDRNCRDCHQLTFDEALPDSVTPNGKESVVPHGNEALVLPYLLKEYSRQSGRQIDKKIEDLRKIPGHSINELKKDPAFVRILTQARAAEETLFTKTSCNLCHQVNKEESEIENLESRYRIEKPQIPQPWLSKADFPHSSHEIVSCESCHSQALKSEKTSDILLPQIDNCQLCHKDSGHKDAGKQNSVHNQSFSHAQIESDCISCHNYHDQQQLSKEQKKELEPLLKQISSAP